jgi:NDP-sugar pyrophosphorylase family protein
MKLLILAAGLGSRFGGPKQLAAVGPDGESLPEYNIFDARRAGFSGIVLLIRRDMEEDVKASLVSRLPPGLPVEFAYQDPREYVPESLVAKIEATGRKKPWGTAHALLCAWDFLQDGPFAVINGDDFYGRMGFAAMKRFFDAGENKSPPECCLTGYKLSGVVPPGGTVSRAVCDVDERGCLVGIREHKSVMRRAGQIVSVGESVREQILDPEVLISMNMWGLRPELFPWIRELFLEFLTDPGHWAVSEFLLPEVMGKIVNSGKASFRVLPVYEHYFGLTNPEDLADARKAALERIRRGEYPSPLWGEKLGAAVR